ncbi:MAG: hypothetical protein R3354_04210 [Thiohalomonadales bacterium]|nr:hypothetical protein [Thiohalomonadales bacterium]
MIFETGMEHDNAHHKRLPHGGVGVTQHPQGFQRLMSRRLKTTPWVGDK